jgi:hypothetical protein
MGDVMGSLMLVLHDLHHNRGTFLRSVFDHVEGGLPITRLQLQKQRPRRLDIPLQPGFSGPRECDDRRVICAGYECKGLGQPPHGGSVDGLLFHGLGFPECDCVIAFGCSTCKRRRC